MKIVWHDFSWAEYWQIRDVEIKRNLSRRLDKILLLPYVHFFLLEFNLFFFCSDFFCWI